MNKPLSWVHCTSLLVRFTCGCEISCRDMEANDSFTYRECSDPEHNPSTIIDSFLHWRQNWIPSSMSTKEIRRIRERFLANVNVLPVRMLRSNL